MLYFQVNTLGELSVALGVSPSVLSNWKKRNTIDWELLFSKCEKANLNWLIYGEGQTTRNQTSTPDLASMERAALEMISNLSAENALLKKENDQLKRGDYPAARDAGYAAAG